MLKRDVRILVVSPIVSDAELVKKIVLEEFSNVAVSTDQDKAVQDFEKYRPHVLILAFNTLEKAECYYLGLYRLGTLVQTLPHRTLILCNKEDLRRVYELCKKEYFDDYILFWPMVHDGHRLHMAIYHALRQMSDLGGDYHNITEIASQARRIAELEASLDQYASKGDQHVDVASRSLQQAKQAIRTALDSFSHQLTEGRHPDLVEVRDHAGFQREFDRLKSEQIETNFDAVAAAVQPVREWAGALKDNLAPQVESARALKTLADRIRPLVLMVDDDEYQHRLLEKMLKDENLHLVFAATCAQAFAVLRKRRPDLILMDVNLPDIDGIEATRRLKCIEQFAVIPVIMITGMSEKDVVVESQRAGASDFVVKPISKSVLIAKISKYVSGGVTTET